MRLDASGEPCARKSVKHGADIGIAHDGDADRVLLCDETGTMIDGDDIMAIAARDMLEEGHRWQKTVVATVMSNDGLDAAIQAMRRETWCARRWATRT